MNDTLLFIVVIGSALFLILGTASLMDRRRKSTQKTESQVSPGPASRIVLWISYGILAITILLVVGAFALRVMLFANLAWSFLLLYIIAGIIYRIVRPRGM